MSQRKVVLSRAIHATWWVLIWAILWALLVFASRNNHPNFRLNALASGLLVAGAMLFSRIPTSPWYWKPLGLLALGGLTAVMIHLIYDILWGPDPNRFSFWMNWFLDGVSVGVLWFAHRLISGLGFMIVPSDK